MAADNSIIVLDDDEEDEAAAQPGPSYPPPNQAQPLAAVSDSLPSSGEGSSSSGGSKKCYQLENEKLFEEFLDLCKKQTGEHPEVVPFLFNRRQRARPTFLASAELRNVLSRVLSRAQTRPTKLYVYINELCTVLKAHSIKRKVPLTPASTSTESPGDAPTNPSSNPAPTEETAPGSPRPRGSRRQIQRLEQLLALYVEEIKRLQEKELDLSELDDPDSAYLQEGRLKRKLLGLFGRLCELKACSSLTGRVTEQRIPYRGTRYPEVNRCVERLINRPGPDAFPDYGDVLRAVEKAATRHGLCLPRRQLQLLAQDAFRDVGTKLQERRHLDLVYNFGCHLTDDYRPGIDPALSDPILARRLRENRSLALSRLDEVISKYALMQDESEEGERQRKRARFSQGNSPHNEDLPTASTELGEGPSGKKSTSCPTVSKIETDEDEDEEDDEEEDEEDEDEELTDSEEEMEDSQEGLGEEDEPGKSHVASQSPSQRIAEEKLEPEQRIDSSSSSVEEDEAGMSGSYSLPQRKKPVPICLEKKDNGEQLPSEELSQDAESPASQLFELVIEALPLDTVPSPEDRDLPSPTKCPVPPLPTSLLENGAPTVTSTSFNGGVSPNTLRVPSPSLKKSLKEDMAETELIEHSCIEVQTVEEQENGKRFHFPSAPSPLASSLVLVADSSTAADSPSHGLVSSSRCSPPPPRPPRLQAPRPAAFKMSVATQCDPEEIIILSDSD
ncbi:death domain-associated protein 6 isoform X2 [Dromiciops gliroides]|uniref:death domain-associated protein 6 isoform X2 n=1 Tax=Dromiciops gliroides TaxID=33562 RepID=UPI001CC741BF|nr:death domain-associated protein 6 isoform X2 [Dromiciops gliroides]XP_043819027.1 death domain-associated protein 6 isoform X2 [Dromiciops gliroides]XP_043819028.1 death domain-associated protein 6 isoform X2 [Dromiciops gliroides]